MKRVFRRIFHSFLLLVAIVGVALIVNYDLRRQAFWLIRDQASYYNSPELNDSFAQITQQLNLTKEGERLLVVSQPSLETAAQFNQNCPNREATSYILGCFNQGKIFVYDVPNSELVNAIPVTTAHELLHAAWERMSVADRTELEPILEENYRKNRNEELDRRMEMYAETEPGQRSNELHSILGSEFTDLTPELEEHYRRWFANRQTVAQIHQAFKEKFLSLERQSDQLLAEMNRLRSEAEQEKQAYQQAVSDLNAKINQFNQRASRLGGFSSEAEFNIEKSKLLARQAEINQWFEQANQKVSRVNELVVQINQLNRTLQNLSSDLNSQTPPERQEAYSG